MSAPAGCPANAFERYGLELIEEPVVPEPRLTDGAEHPSRLSGLGPFDWGLLAGLAVVQLAYLWGWALLARWAIRHWTGA